MQLICFEQSPYWRPHYADKINTLIENIPKYSKRVRKFVEDTSNQEFVNGFLETYRNIYIKEISCGENIGVTDLIDIEKALRQETPTTHIKKIQNISNAINYIFGEAVFLGVPKCEFNATLAKELNRVIGEQLFNNAGVYRENCTKPFGYNFVYLEATLIENHMNKLFIEVNRDLDFSMCNWFEIAARFYGTFLYIHPFINGNGRTARLLLSVLLIKCALIPVSLFSSSFKNNSNAEYLNCLEEAHAYGNYKLLTSLIIESTHRSLSLFLDSLDIDYIDT